MGTVTRRIIYNMEKQDIIWPEMFKRFTDDGFSESKNNKKVFKVWVNDFICLRENGRSEIKLLSWK